MSKKSGKIGDFNACGGSKERDRREEGNVSCFPPPINRVIEGKGGGWDSRGEQIIIILMRHHADLLETI